MSSQRDIFAVLADAVAWYVVAVLIALGMFFLFLLGVLVWIVS